MYGNEHKKLKPTYRTTIKSHNKICWPIEFTEYKHERTWKLDTRKIIFPMFKGHQENWLVFGSIRFSVYPRDNEHVVRMLCDQFSKGKLPLHKTKAECLQKYKGEHKLAIRKPKSKNLLGWNTVRLSAIPS